MLKIIKRKILFFFLLSIVYCSANSQDHTYSLEECIKIAFENNLTVQRGNLDQQSALINQKLQKMSRLPDFTVTGASGSSWGRSIDPTTNQFETKKINSARFGGQSTVTLYNGLAISNSIKQSIIDYKAGTADLEKVKNDVALSVANLYLNVIFNQELQKNSDFQLNSITEQLDRIKKLVDAGALPITNLLDLQAQKATNEVNLINAENNYNLALLQLKQALLIPAEDPFQIEVPDLEVGDLQEVDFNTSNVYKTAEGSQPEIKSADFRILSADLGVKISKSAYQPRLTLSGSFGTNYSSLANRARDDFSQGVTPTNLEIGLVDIGNQTYQVYREFSIPNATDPDFTFTEQLDENLTQAIGFNLVIPVFNKWRTKSDVQRSLINRRRAEINAAEVRNNLRQTIETAYSNFVAASKSYSASEKQVAALEESYRVIESQYGLGAVNSVDYQVAANNLYMARSDKLRAKYDYIFKSKVLDFYLGKPLSF